MSNFGDLRSDTDDPSGQPLIRSYKTRQGRASDLTTDTMNRLGPRFLLDPEQAFDPIASFGRDLPVMLEIGSGSGEATIAMAANDPAVSIVAIEVHTRGVARLLQRLDAESIDNVRIVHSDAVPYLRDCLAPSSLMGARIYFPDPWPKGRHHKRRLLQKPFIDLLTSRLSDGAVLHCATDWQPYAGHMLQVLTSADGLENTCEAFAPRPAWRPLTRYESAGLDKGHDVYDLVFKRCR